MTKKPQDTTLNCSDVITKDEGQQQTPESSSKDSSRDSSHVAQNAVAPNYDLPVTPAQESGGQAGLDPTRYGDWEKKGRCTDF
ncbi:MAG: hypothetical protein ACI8VW_001008 [bacterium]|jgi:hypothetical protein